LSDGCEACGVRGAKPNIYPVLFYKS